MDVTRLSDRTRKLRAFLCVLTLICTGGLAVASPYDLDPSFGDGGKLLIGPGSAGAPSQLLLQQDGRFFVFSGSIWRFNPDGTLDPTFGNGSGTVSQSQICNSLVVVGYICYVQSIATQPDGKILVALLRGIYGYGLAFGVERLLADGTPDQAFGAGGLSFLSTVAPTTSDYGGIILVQTNGDIVIAGDSTTTDSLSHPLLSFARFLPNGTPDGSFGAGGRLVTPLHMTVSAFVQQPDSKLLASGFPDNDSPSSTLVARFLPNGEFDSTFAVGGTYTDPSPTGVFPFGMVVQPDGNLIVAGKALLNGAPQFALLRFDVNGNLDLSFGNAGKVVLQMDERNASEATAVALDSHQRIVVVGLLASEAQFSPSLPVSMSRIGVARFNTDGSPDLFFGPHGATAFWSGFGSIGTAVIILSGDKILVGGAVGGAAQYNVGVWVIPQSGALFRLQGGDGTVPLLIREEHAIEYYDNVFGHYFISATPYEIAYLDTFYSQAWVRTGRSFRVWTEAAPGLQQVCRFFSDQSFAPKSSHFYTPYPNECAALQAGTVWKFEGYVFELQLPAGMPGQGTCPEGTAPLYRLYNNGQGGAPNHRYTDDLTVFNQMLAQGWIFEGEAQTKVFACIPAQ